MLGSIPEPFSIHEAMQHSCWATTVKVELDALVTNHTWFLVPLPSGRHSINCKWIFKVKKKPDCSIDRCKARLVARGFSQKPGIDFQDTFNPIVKPQTMRIILTIDIPHHWTLYQIDVNNAFLHGVLHEKVYMTQPPGFQQQDAHGHALVC